MAKGRYSITSGRKNPTNLLFKGETQKLKTEKFEYLIFQLTRSGFKPTILWSSRQFQHSMHLREIILKKTNVRFVFFP
jgi:hypothetical protein